jgi:CRISPR/Cas system-associated exonuclease Cas4 (RecB family)
MHTWVATFAFLMNLHIHKIYANSQREHKKKIYNRHTLQAQGKECLGMQSQMIK